MDIYRSCSRHFTFEMLFHCGETWQRIQCPNLPEQNDSWLAYRELATHILDPLVHMFGPASLTYGFCGAVLRKTILANPSPGIAPPLISMQHVNSTSGEDLSALGKEQQLT
ncbi:TPA: hypothetical protein ACNUUK_000525 [Aeromonas salmonicida subsp. smithia]